MKKNRLLTVLVMTVMCFSCTKDDISENNPEMDAIATNLKSTNSHEFEVGLSEDGVTYEDTICINPSEGYSLKLLNSNFTGYLEVRAKNPGTNNQWVVEKWFKVTNGYVNFPDGQFINFTHGYYYAQFRIWIHDGSNLPWSNMTNVIIHPWLC